jgi:radical SAM superfamily enzyme YgiQ (UPF0313 family)
VKPRNKIILVVPPVKPGGDRFLTSSVNVPHMGLAYLAAVLQQDGFTVEVLDAQIAELDFIKFEQAIRRINPNIMGITAFTEQVEEARLAGRIIKRINPDIPVIVGGCHPTALPELTLKEFPDFDFAVFGEGEATIYLRPGKILNLFRIVRLRVLFLSVWFQMKKYISKG